MAMAVQILASKCVPMCMDIVRVSIYACVEGAIKALRTYNNQIVEWNEHEIEKASGHVIVKACRRGSI